MAKEITLTEEQVTAIISTLAEAPAKHVIGVISFLNNLLGQPKPEEDNKEEAEEAPIL